MDRKSISSLLAYRCIALDEKPGIHPTHRRGTYRCIITKTVLSVVGDYVQEVAGTRQLCAGQALGIKAGIHCVGS